MTKNNGESRQGVWMKKVLKGEVQSERNGGKSHFGLFDLEKRILLIYMVSKSFVEFVIIFVIVVFRAVSIER